MKEDTRKIYEAHGFDTSKPLRKLTDITDEEAQIIGEIFGTKHPPWIIERKYRKNGNWINQIFLYSQVYSIPCMQTETTIPHQDRIVLDETGEIDGKMFAEQKTYELVNQYLFSIGIERPILKRERLEALSLKKVVN